MLHNQPELSSLTVDLHGLKLTFQTPAGPLRERFEQIYGHLTPVENGEGGVVIHWEMHEAEQAPPPPADMPVISEGSLVSYYGDETGVAVRLPKYGLITVDLATHHLRGAVTRACLESYGVFEDALMISLAPLYRRRGWFPLHAFAALSPTGRAVLITGAMGSGKTTTGLALLNAGWKLLSNDSPLLMVDDGQVKVLAYPGRLSAFDDSLTFFKSLHRFLPTEAAHAAAGQPKRVFRAEEAFDEPWALSGVAGAVFFPQVVPGLAQSELAVLPATEGLLKLMPQAIEGWDKAAIGQSLALLGRLVEQAPCYLLRLAPDVENLPAVIEASLI